MLCAAPATVLTSAAAVDAVSFKTGTSLEKSLSAKVSWSSVGAPVGDQLRDLQTQAEVVIFRDRRVDPRQLVSVKTEFVPRIQVLKRISANIPGGACCVTEHFVCVGPFEAVFRLPILLEQNRNQFNAIRNKVPAAVFRRVSADVDVSWPELAEPRQILLDQAMIAGITIRNPDAIPHDVWSAGQLPRLTVMELTTVILNQFDLRMVIVGDAAELMIVPLDPDESLEHRYVVGNKLKSSVATAWQSRAPSVDIQWSGSTAIVAATLPQHAILNSVLSDLQHPDTSIRPVGSIRTTSFQFKAERATIGELIDYFRTQNVPIEVNKSDEAETKALLTQTVRLDTITEKHPGTKFFPLIFGRHFAKVDVLDDRVILSRE